MKNIELFKFNNNEVRVVTQNGEPWFVANDVAKTLDLGHPRSSLALLDDDERGVQPLDTPGGAQNMTVVNESGLYALVLRSRKPEAKQFKRWIIHEVLPAIRKHGGYLTNQKIEEALLNPDTLIQLATNLKNEQEKRRELEAQIEADKPAVEYVNQFVARRDDTITIRDAAADIGVKETVLRQALLDGEWIYRKRVGQHYSVKQQRVVDDYEYRAYAEKQHLFVLRPHHNAPRLYNGQVRQTLYLNPEGLAAVKQWVDRGIGE
ncbi:BRO family protein [Leucobacter sp. OH1287]|uniref:BRO family protein n=1 Tax=Leucobacter sp. OH1287 TaxID=2491049 RepID=UPI000F5D6CAF|nr:BRO family protein [Leucobacter sp. OH1287]RRD59515.1 hypothetical protein EII30_08505 [Leucobacter sp. OH1287]